MPFRRNDGQALRRWLLQRRPAERVDGPSGIERSSGAERLGRALRRQPCSLLDDCSDVVRSGAAQSAKVQELFARRPYLESVGVNRLQSLTALEKIADDRFEEAPAAELLNPKARARAIFNDKVTDVDHSSGTPFGSEGTAVVERVKADGDKADCQQRERSDRASDHRVVEKKADCNRRDERDDGACCQPIETIFPPRLIGGIGGLPEKRRRFQR